ncbi:unnamed protein product [Pseudo-nitzschia multistriata]|uniref:Nudix hydrolase domain-containing protein n=1 Tax=Pseudo-nitzschia multistriata TaxID=183589 RepID=A0A448Z8C6_9STRA|nr:unnamed protein product [Pseudo-nitzschia multistriata]
MKLLQRIRALDASRRLDVMNKYIPAVLVENQKDFGESSSGVCVDNTIIIGHIHSDLIDLMRINLDEGRDDNSFCDSFLFPPLLDDASTSSLTKRFFGLRVNEIPQGESPIARTDARNAILEQFTSLLLECKVISKKHTDMYPVKDLRNDCEGEILAEINRSAAPFLGISSVGVHLLCYVRGDGTSRDDDTVCLWLAQRAANKSHNALRWDPTVAGGQPASLSLFDNLVKEAGEEAGIDPCVVARNAVSTGCLSQMTCKPNGACMKPSLYYTWDMQVGSNFVPHPADGEVAKFQLFSAKELEHEVRNGDRLRPAMILVVTDFLIRHGVITPDNEPDYAQILAAMHRERLILDYQ